MSLGIEEVSGLLKGIESHARAGNFDHVSIQARHLLERMESAIQTNVQNSSEFREALPAVRALIADGTRSDSPSVLVHATEAKEALHIAPGITPAWPTTPAKTHHHPARSRSPQRPRVVQRPVSSPVSRPFSLPGCIDLNTASAQDLRDALAIDESVVQQILHNRPYRDWQDFSGKNPGFSEPQLTSLQQAGVTISPVDLHKIV